MSLGVGEALCTHFRLLLGVRSAGLCCYTERATGSVVASPLPPETAGRARPTRKGHHVQDILEHVALATSLREGPEGVARVLRAVHTAERIHLKDLARQVKLPVPVLAAVRRELEKIELMERGGGILLSAAGRRFVEEELGLSTRHDPTCSTCAGRRVVVGEVFRQTVETLGHYLTTMPTVDVTLDQAFPTAETSVRRALYLYQSGALEGRRVILLGDDDLLSLSTSLLARALGVERLARRLTVLELDPRILEVLETAAACEGFELEIRPHDLRDPLPEDLVGEFDVFETDPPYTRSGAKLFVSRGVEALDPGLGRQGFLSLGARDPDEHLAIHRDLLDMGLVLTDLIPSFNEYQGASMLGGTSQILRLETTLETAPALGGERYEEPIYTGESSPTRRLYRCLGCGEKVSVGKGEGVETVEALKAAGCGGCGAGKFRFVRRL